MRQLLRGKIHRAVVTETDPDYIGSITVDRDLLKKADIWPGELVLISDVDNGARFETYVIVAESGSGTVAVNGSAAHLVKTGHKVIIMAFEITDSPITPKIILVDEKNRFVRYLHRD
ncbi:MAG: aspartate 1-decarboxylase [Methanomassiliicoccales archaeon]|jgi:aspartate 1-decarboxylase